jgi:cbb3-type cytochrome oxidase maturation protein
VSVIVVLIGFSVLVAGGFLAGFLWAVRSGQYDDRHTPAVRMLFDDEVPREVRTKERDGDGAQASQSPDKIHYRDPETQK